MPARDVLKRAKTSQSTSHVLVVGGSFSGICAVETLKGSRTPMTVTLISRSNVFEFLPATYRCLVNPEHIESVTTPLTGRGFKFVHGTVVSIGRFDATVQLHGENAVGEEKEVQTLHFDFCIWATGIGYPEPLYSTARFLKQRRKCFDSSRMDILNAKSILVVGGGPVGVELAAELSEIPTASNQKSITVCTKGFELMKGLPEKARWYAEMWLRNKGVRVITASNVQVCDGGATLLLNTEGVAPTIYKGHDLVLWATGNRHGQTTQPLHTGGLVANEDLDPKGRVWVRSTLQLPRARHFFACGDCAVVACDRKRDLMSKTAYAAMEAGSSKDTPNTHSPSEHSLRSSASRSAPPTVSCASARSSSQVISRCSPRKPSRS